MALSERDSRSIDVDGREYRYSIREGSDTVSGWLHRRVVVQAATGRGAKLLATTEAEPASIAHASIGPGKVAALIRQALARGWRPDLAGKPFPITFGWGSGEMVVKAGAEPA